MQVQIVKQLAATNNSCCSSFLMLNDLSRFMIFDFEASVETICIFVYLLFFQLSLAEMRELMLLLDSLNYTKY